MPDQDERLDAVLRSVGEHLVVPEVDAAPRVGAHGRADRHGRRVVRGRPLAMAAAVLLVVGVAALVVTPAREAVADWLGIGSTRVERVPAGDTAATGDPDGAAAGLPPLRDGAVPVSRADAESRLGGSLPTVTDPALGAPRQLAVPPEGGVVMAWERGATTLWVHELEDAPLVKQVAAGVDVRPVAGLGDEALLVTGDHVLQAPTRRVAAAAVVLWVDDGVQYRLESDLGAEAMVAVARSVRPGG